MIGTIIRQAVDTGSVVAFEEVELLNAAWTPSLILEIDGSFQILPTSYITVKTVNGFTLGTMLQAGFIFGTVSDAGGTEAADPDLAANAICTLNDIKSYLKKSASDTDDDAFLKNTINRVSGIIEDWVNSRVVQQSITGLILDGDGSNRLTLPAKYVPITQIGTGAAPAEADIQYRGSPTEAWADLLTDIDNAVISNIPSNWIYLASGVFSQGVQNIKLNLKAGYATIATVFTQVCIEAVVEIFKESNREGARLGVSSRSAGVEGMTGNTSYYQLSARHKAMLAPYAFPGFNRTKNTALWR